MEITTQEYIVKHIVIGLAGRFDAYSVPNVQKQLDTLRKEEAKHFILDLTQIEFMDSAGLAVLVKLLKRVQDVGGTVSLVMPKEEAARRILRLTRFDQIFPIVETVKAAVSKF